MKEAISFLLNFIGRRDCNAGGRHCDVEQLGARLAHTQEVAGSSPAVPMSPGRSRIADSTSGHCPAKIKMIWIFHINRTRNIKT